MTRPFFPPFHWGFGVIWRGFDGWLQYCGAGGRLGATGWGQYRPIGMRDLGSLFPLYIYFFFRRREKECIYEERGGCRWQQTRISVRDCLSPTV